MSFDTNKFMKRMFRRVDGIVWDIVSGATGIRTENGVFTISFSEAGEPTVTVNPLDMSMALPGFATQTPHVDVQPGDIIVGDSKILGWVVDKTEASFKLIDVQGMGKNYTPPKVAIMGGEGPLVVRNLFNLTGGQQGVAQLLPLMMLAGGDNSKIEKFLPLMLMQQPAPAAAGAGATNPMAAMLPLLLMKDGGFGKGGKIDPLMLMAMGGMGGGAMNPMMLMALMGDDTPTASSSVSLPAPIRTGPPPLSNVPRS